MVIFILKLNIQVVAVCFTGCMGDTQFHFRIRCSPHSCHKSHLVRRYEDEVPLAYRV